MTPIFYAQVVQLFDSWAHHLSPDQFAEFSLPYAERVITAVRSAHPSVPLIYHANGGEPRHTLEAHAHATTQMSIDSEGACNRAWYWKYEIRVSDLVKEKDFPCYTCV